MKMVEHQMDDEEIKERVDKFFDKEGLDIQSKYFLTKKLNEEYWEEIQGEEEGDEDLLGELGEEEPEGQEEPTEPEEEIAAPKPPKPTKKKITIKKPKVTAKKEETPKEPEKPEDETI